MAYTKPNAYADGVVLDAVDQIENDAVARRAINQETYIANIAAKAFDYDDIQRGEYEPVTQSHQFTTGDIYGLTTDTNVNNRAYFTAETKAVEQTTGVQYQDIYHTGKRFFLERGGAFFINFGASFVSMDNSNASGGPGPGLWDSTIYLRIKNISTNTTTYVAGTLSYTYEESGATASGTTDPGGKGSTARRWTGWQWLVKNQNAGAYEVCVVVNPKVEQGYADARTFTIETFYV
jgi:hypothetical protein